MQPFVITGNDMIVASAIHDGHALRPEIENRIALSESERLREEDPFTSLWSAVASTRIIGLNSRFEVDLNRPREKAVYQHPDDAWGLDVWRVPLDQTTVATSLKLYDEFYQAVHATLTELLKTHRYLVVLDLHSYNHRRSGPGAAPANPDTNPEVNLGTGTMDREFWSPLIDRLLHDLRSFDFLGRQLDVRENVKFKGGEFGRWIHTTFPNRVCAPAIEYKKFFMDEWTGEPDSTIVQTIRDQLQATLPGIRESLTTCFPKPTKLDSSVQQIEPVSHPGNSISTGVE